MKKYEKTRLACYMAFITQAIAANFTPLLFIWFHTVYKIPLGTIALIPTSFFFTQLLVDLFCAKYVDRIGYRTSIVAAQTCAALGLAGMAVVPELFSSPFVGIILCVIIYAIGSGLIEVLASPIMEACPFENKAATMSLLHSFYCWGSVGTILLSTLFLRVFGMNSWKVLTVLWALVPAVNIYNFARCPIEHLTEDGEGMSVVQLLKKPLFWVSLVLMVCAGASEISMSQWASAYAETALGLSKMTGDLVGPCLFAVTMGFSRVLYGKYGEKVDLLGFMVGSGILCVICYILAAFTSRPLSGLLGCILCGFSVGIMWPGTISISSRTFPLGGTAMFALLAMAGDLGGSIGPSMVGQISQAAGDSIQAGLKVGLVFPAILVVMAVLLMKFKKNAG